jgi:hypothetical protein
MAGAYLRKSTVGNPTIFKVWPKTAEFIRTVNLPVKPKVPPTTRPKTIEGEGIKTILRLPQSACIWPKGKKERHKVIDRAKVARIATILLAAGYGFVCGELSLPLKDDFCK